MTDVAGFNNVAALPIAVARWSTVAALHIDVACLSNVAASQIDVAGFNNVAVSLINVACWNTVAAINIDVLCCNGVACYRSETSDNVGYTRQCLLPPVGILVLCATLDPLSTTHVDSRAVEGGSSRC